MEVRSRPTRQAAVLGPPSPATEVILSAEALAFVADLARRFTPRVRELLARRRDRQVAFDAGVRPDFSSNTADIRSSPWTVAPMTPDLVDRRVEITGPVDRKMVINALNSGASTYMADFEDATTPVWSTLLEGQLNLRDAVRRVIRHTDPVSGREYALARSTATLLVRPRGWHLWEKHLRVDESFVPAGLFDFGLYMFHNARALVARRSGPYFYLPKLESHLEARLWNDVFLAAQEALGLPAGTIRATVLIETLPAAFEMDEILWELRHHSSGLNCGRWDYIFSFIKVFAEHPSCTLPDRSSLTMEQRFLRACSHLLIRTCHRRGIHAMGGMAAQIPLPDPEASRLAIAQVRADKLREVTDGHDGTWVAHPALVAVARDVFDTHMPGPHQIHRAGGDLRSSPEDLLRVPVGPRSEEGLRTNVRVALHYLASWLGGVGCVPIDGRMEDAATAEISRSQIWQWIRHGARLDDGRRVTSAMFLSLVEQEMARLRSSGRVEEARLVEARVLLERLCLAGNLPDFLTSAAYDRIVTCASTDGEL